MFPYNLITPPSEMRTAAFASSVVRQDNSRLLTSKVTFPTTVLVSRCPQQYIKEDSYVEAKRPSMNASTTATSVSSPIIRTDSPLIDFDSHDFDVGEFTATVSLSSGV